MLDPNIPAHSVDRQQQLSILTLPLNVIAHLLSFVEDPADLARVCRTCRIFNYMAIPQLYRNPVLISYDRIRYRDDRPEGWGSASPFSMGISTLVTRSHASLVESLTLRGEWREPQLEEHSRVGRVPDSAMMLNVSVRAAIDRTKDLRSFSWELDTKMLEIVYLGLNQLPMLTSLSLRFPSTRHPRPTIVIPAFPHLRSLRVTDIDPLCYPDDISTLLANSRNLRDLKLHWSPRMREAQEPSVLVHDYFRKAIAAKMPLKLKRIGIQNLYARQTDEFHRSVDSETIEELTVFSHPGLDGGDLPFSFVDKSWASAPPRGSLNYKMLRQDFMAKPQFEFIMSINGLERVYFVNPGSGRPFDGHQRPGASTRPIVSANGRPSPMVENVNGSRFAGVSLPPSPSLNPSTNTSISLRDIYFPSIIRSHGPSLRHLLLPAKWPLALHQINLLVENCPHLKQLALATEVSAQETLKLLLPSLRKLVAIRLLHQYFPCGATSFVPNGGRRRDQMVAASPSDGESASQSNAELADPEGDLAVEEEAISRILADRSSFGGLKVIGLGWKGWDLGGFYKVPADVQVDGSGNQASERIGAGSQAFLSADRSLPLMRNPSTLSAVSATISSPRPVVSFSKPSATNARSSLGKRAREPPSAPEPSAVLFSLSNSLSTEQPESPSSTQPPDQAETRSINYPEPIVETLPSGETVIWKRRVRQLPWNVLRQWEIWGLDSQEL